MSTRTPVKLSRQSSKPKTKQVTGMSSPLCRKKRSSPRSDEKVARPRRRLAVGTDKRRDGGKRHQKDGYDEIAAVAECEDFHADLNRLINWLSTSINQSEHCKAPSIDTLSIRVQLEKYLAFAMEIQTHQHQKDSVILRGQDFIHQYPQLQPSLEATLHLIAAQYRLLEERLDTQFRQLEGALSVLETNTRSELQSFKSFDSELMMDSIEQMSFRLENSKRRNSSMEIHVNALNKQVDTFNTSSKLSSTGGSDTSCSSSPDFDVLYEELSDWLSDLHMAVTDSQQCQSDQRMAQVCKGYTQELQMREVTRSKLNKKANHLLTRRPSTCLDVTAKLQSINQQWTNLQARLTPSAEACSPGTVAFTSSEEAMTVTLEVEEVIVQLKGWLTEMERNLFATESIKCPGSIQQIEKRLAAHEEIQADIAKNSEGIRVVLNLCDILQRDKHACASDKERDSLQLAAFNLERRCQAIQAQAMALQCNLEEKVRTFKDYSTIAAQKDDQEPSSCEEAVADDESIVQTSLKKPILRAYQPSGAKDDSDIFGLGQSINYDDILLVREAFSENDAYSISDTSTVSLGDFAFDDVLLMKEEEVVPSVPTQTPDIMELSDEMIDAYLRMEEDQLRQEDEIDCDILPEVADIRGRSNSELEFWSMSLRDDNVMTTSVELPHVMPSLEDLDRVPVLLQNGISKPSPSFTLEEPLHSPTNYRPITLGKYSLRTVDHMSSVVEDALESLCSDEDDEFEEDFDDIFDEDFDDEFDGDDEDEDVDVTLTEERCQSKITPDEEVEDVEEAFGHLVFDIEDLEESLVDPSQDLKPAKPLSRSLPVTYRSTVLRDVQTHDYPASFPSQPVSNTWSHPSVTIAKTPHQKKGFFPSHANCFLPNAFDDVHTSSPVKDRPVKSTPSSKFHKLRRRLSQVSNTPIEEETTRRSEPLPQVPQDNLLNITDLSLSHMYESLDFATELTNSLMPGAHHSRDDVDSPLDFPLLDRMDDSDCESFSESEDEGSEREDPVQTWINNNMPTPPQISPLEMPCELTFTPSYNLDASIQEIPTHDLPSLPVCNHTEVHIQQDVSDALFTPGCAPELGISQAQEMAGFLESVSTEREVDLGLCADSAQVEIADEEVTTEPDQQETVTNQHTAVHECCSVSQLPDDSVSNGGFNSRVKNSRDLNIIKERLRKEIMEQSNKKQAYFTYVSQLAEACTDDAELGQILGEFNRQKCYLWSIGGSLEQPKQAIDNTHDNLSTMDDSWMELMSQCSDDTDKLLEASSSLIEELERSSRMQVKPLPEDEIGSWRDVIILWLNEQGVTSVAPSHDVTDHSDAGVTDCDSRMVKEAPVEGELGSILDLENKPASSDLENTTDNGVALDCSLQDVDGIDAIGISSPWSPSSEMVDSGNFSADGILDEESLAHEKTLSPLTSSPEVISSTNYHTTLSKHIVTLESPILLKDTMDVATGQYPTPATTWSRVLCIGIPICIFLFLCVLFVILLPAVVTSATGDCSYSLIDNILLNSPSWEPILYYVRGPPPQ
ncbi:uncharacterized protein LOC117290589 isoform X1 [Asterias rubens]|uniref:uncharacterized protein LOC117290589 isoform X1 n=1 Tax=Asterias rubens TaxID=7604 RepID=UPI0014558941|nr:uncharacterized protein LOC117290589 isoform X1 [Asterias rubens]XP_033627950.1 uncharacterized protein LOC117290589 isoform X1 [Asterias rubens]XP_033627956.1 uncharacterized protein LOC117290589 isoform X1 [Asterias rubens]XP_033627964.1 uncharacterized protein LOC117290589 isoform X1 [Asterias rubens]XP_033627972.1 uncharacterized protein LOC117290589 isoform X1 [Asterias rubens]